MAENQKKLIEKTVAAMAEVADNVGSDPMAGLDIGEVVEKLEANAFTGVTMTPSLEEMEAIHAEIEDLPAVRELTSHVFYMEHNATVFVPDRYEIESVTRLSPTHVEVLAWV